MPGIGSGKAAASPAPAPAAIAPAAPPPAPAAGPSQPAKLVVCLKPQALTAVRLTADQQVQLADGRSRVAPAGDYLITRNRVVLDVVSPRQFAETYQQVADSDLSLSTGDRTRLEQTLGLGATRNAAILCEAVERLAKIEIGGIRIEFTPGQLDEISYRAKKRGQTVEQALKATIDRIREELFWRS